MAIVHLGAKRLQGTKVDRVVDSLGSSADGSASGITLVDNYVRCKVYNSSGVEQTEFTSAKLRSDIGTSAFENVTMTGSHTVAQGDRIVMQTDGGDSSNKILFLRNNSNGNDNPSNTSYVRYESGSFSTQSKSITGNMIFNGSTVNLSSATDEADSYPTSNEKFGLQIDASASQIGQTLTSVTFKLKRVGNNPAKLGTGAYYFDGSDSTKPNVKISDIDLFSGATKEYTLSFWLKADFDHDSSSDNRCIFDFSGSNQIQFFKHPSANWKLNFDSGSDLTLSGGTEAVPDDGAFHHICVTRNSSSLYTVYVDGVSKGTITQTLNVNSGSALNFYLGSYDSVDQEFWKGWIDDVGIWSRVLTTTEIEKLVNNNTGGFSIATFNNTSLASYDSANNEIDFEAKVNSSQQNGAFAIDMLGQTVSDTQWTMRMKVNFSNIGGGNGSNISFNIAKNGHTTSNATAENLLGWAWGEPPTDGGTGSGQNYIGIRQGTDSSGASASNYPVNTSGWYTDGWEDSAENTDYYIELKRTSATNAEFTVWAGSYGGTQKVNISRTDIPSGTVDLRYFKFCNRSNDGQPRSGNTSGALKELSFWNGTNDTTETANYTQVKGDAQLVSSLSDKSGLKAHYTMDSTALSSLKGTADWTEDFSETTPTAWAEDSSSGYANNLEPYKGSVNRLWFDLDRTSSAGVIGTFDFQNAGLLGANPSNTLWTMRFKINFTSLSSAAGSMFIGLTDSSSAGTNGACRFAGVRFKTTDGIRNISDNGGQSLIDSNRTDGGLASTITTGTDYYITISRHTANTLVTTVRSGSHTGTVVGEVTADTLETATDDLRYWKIQNHRASANGGQLQGYVYDLEFFNDSATTTGSKNDFSTTSALDGYTNVPVNTIFEQIDDTPTYWWKQSDNTWALDGSVSTSVSTASSTGWTLQAGATGDINVNSTSSGKLYYDLDAVNGTSQIMTYDLGSALSDEKWVMRLVVNNSTWGTLSQGFVTLSSTTTGSDATGDNIGFTSLYGGSGNKRLRFLSAITDQKLKDTLDSDTYSDSNTTTGTDYFIEIARTSSTAATMKIRTGSHSGTLLSTLTLPQGSNDLSTNTDLRYLKVSNLNSSGWGGNVKGTIHGIEIQNGTGEWLE